MIRIFDYKDSDGKAFIDKITNRLKLDYNEEQKAVEQIIERVKTNGDTAVFEYTLEFDKAVIDEKNIMVTETEIKSAYEQTKEELLEVIKKSAGRIKKFHEKQKPNSWFETNDGEFLGQLIKPVEYAGVYVPGGKAAYPSSVLMNVIPAKIAGVKNIIMVSPPNRDGQIPPHTIVAAVEAGVDKIFKAGGAQAVAALAFGTDSIPKVDKIVGPGNIYVALAKKSVFGYVDIDSVAGPSEILIIADETANPAYAAADLLSQAEHDEMASAVLLTTSRSFAQRVAEEIERQTETLTRKDIIRKSLADYGAVVITETVDEAVALSNRIAPEHLELCVTEPFNLFGQITAAGAVFLGNYTPEPLGDYMAGPNHILPTGGTARYFSPLGVDDFMKKTSVISFSREAFQKLSGDVIKFAEAEGLTAHANAARIRKL